jgi:Flp pilus assembly protein TadB
MANSGPYDEPKNGDYVAYLAELERRQLSALGGEGNQAPAAAIDKAARGQGSRTPSAGEQSATGGALTREQAQQLLQRLGVARDAAAHVDVSALVPGIIGLVMVLIGITLEGAWFFLLIGAFLIYQMIRSLRRRAAKTTAAQQVNDLFDVQAWGKQADSSDSKRKNAKERR